MDWPDELARDLPAQNEDEPASLRQDIVDELADHLVCALRREQHRTADPQQAQKNVLARFGNPARLARQLWFEAMQEKIMSQRITLAFVAVIALACLAATGLAWQSVQQGREANRLLLEQGREFNTAILAKLQTISQTPAEAPISPDWNPVKVRLVLDEPGRPPAEGFRVTVQGRGENPINYAETSDKDGLADFGLLRPGSYSVVVRTPWQEVGMNFQMTVRPGVSHVHEIVCPPSPPKEAEVAIDIDWPDDLRDRGLWAQCGFTARNEVDGYNWSLRYHPELTTFYGKYGSYERLIIDGKNRLGHWDALLGDDGSAGDGVDSLQDQLQETVTWLTRNYKLELIRVDAGPGPSPGDETRHLAESLAWYGTVHPAHRPGTGFEDKHSRGVSDRVRGRPADADPVRVTGPVSGRDFEPLIPDEELEFEVQADRVNRWTIRLPDEFWDRVRASLAEREDS